MLINKEEKPLDGRALPGETTVDGLELVLSRCSPGYNRASGIPSANNTDKKRLGKAEEIVKNKRGTTERG